MVSQPFLFEAQTGQIYFTSPVAPTNFYRYKIPGYYLAKVKLELEKAIGGHGGFVYSPGFLAWLEKIDLNEKSR